MYKKHPTTYCSKMDTTWTTENKANDWARGEERLEKMKVLGKTWITQDHFDLEEICGCI